MHMSKPMIGDPDFVDLVAEAWAQPIHGWDFSYLEGRMVSEALPWQYDALIRNRLLTARCLLDMGTGGGEFLSAMLPLPGKRVLATEAYMPNLRVASKCLHPLGATVIAVDDGERHLPIKSAAVDLIINRHEDYDMVEIHRLLVKGGTFITQQVGGQDNLELNRFLQGHEAEFVYADWLAESAQEEVVNAGFTVTRFEEAFPKEVFKDIAAVIFYLRIISWQIADFSVEKYWSRLYKLHRHIQEKGGFETRSHRFLIEAVKP